jgi:glutamate transport system permease protein
MEAITDNLDLYLSGFVKSLGICAWGVLGSLVLGTLIAACRVSPVPPLRMFGTFWVNTFRNTPLTLVLFFVAFGFPQLGINASYYWFLILALWLYTSAFVCEAIRSGINAVSTGQAEAARAIGLTFIQSLTLIVLPQAFRAVVPPLGSVLIAMMKNSAIAGLFGVSGDLMSVGSGLIGAKGYPALQVLLGVLVGYLIITLSSGALLGALERKLEVAR